MNAFVSLTGSLLVFFTIGAGLSGAACSGGDDDTTPSSSGGSVIDDFADRAETEFKQRGQATFFDTGVLSYCRQNTGFDSGVFKALGYTNDNAPRDVELCYNLSNDRKKVALGATSKSGRDCVVLDASGGAILRTVKTSGSCSP